MSAGNNFKRTCVQPIELASSFLFSCCLCWRRRSTRTDKNRKRRAKSKPELELSRPARPWEFLSATGTRAALFGNEAGQFEAWVYPLKILRDFHLRFHLHGLDLPAESLARTITVHPESTSILYAGDTFTVRETLFVPVHEPGAIIQLEVDAAEPVEIEAEFQRDFQLEWPGAIAGVYIYWDQNLHAFVFADELKRFAAVMGSPTGRTDLRGILDQLLSFAKEFVSPGSHEQGPRNQGYRDCGFVECCSPKRQLQTRKVTYRRLSTSYSSLLRESSEYYRAYLDRTVDISIPDQTTPNGIRLVAGQHDSRVGRQSFSGQRPGCRVQDFRRQSAPRVCLVLWTRCVVDVPGSRRRRRLYHHAHRIRLPEQVSAGRWQDSA